MPEYIDISKVAKKYDIHEGIIYVLEKVPELSEPIVSGEVTPISLQYAFCNKAENDIYTSTLKACILLYREARRHKYEKEAKIYASAIETALLECKPYIDDTVMKMLFETGTYTYFLEELYEYLKNAGIYLDKGFSFVFDAVLDFVSEHIKELGATEILYILEPIAMNKNLTPDIYNRLVDIGGKYVAGIILKNPSVPAEIKAKARLYVG
jgi:hypothetical protein